MHYLSLSQKHIRHTLGFIIISSTYLLGCQPQADNLDAPVDTQSQTQPQDNTATNQTTDAATDSDAKAKPSSSSPEAIDWSKIDSGVTPIAKDSFDYPFAIDSDPVKSYVDFFHVTPAEAQHNLTVGTASNEPLPALFEQLGDHYISHELTDGKEVQLIIHTTADVAASEHEYVFAEPFAKGLSIPVIIQPRD